ncbi:hypothetical protein AGR3A_Cc260039 [Agrobacterium tomkonis CFBP 6623]|uniref:Uncharacterized protein n=1 Tax=Agrobacterium tomkonis CFBP 6623 TaxID=1183432 RepID=A0A1S7PGT7_9HYPH|nr:hypothetical protein AGR3A_Cc260039 [Agrobacterium tomkonis CFBP 6623]
MLQDCMIPFSMEPPTINHVQPFQDVEVSSPEYQRPGCFRAFDKGSSRMAHPAILCHAATVTSSAATPCR